MSDDERIVINMEDLAEPSPPAAPPGAPRQALPPMPVQAPRIGISGGGPPVVASAGAGSGLARLGANPIVSGLLSGLIGGVLGMLVAENLRNPDKVTIDITQTASQIEQQIRVNSGIWVAIFAAVLGAVIMAWDGITSGSGEKALRDGAIGLGVGAVSGFVGGYVAQWVYSELLPDDPFSPDAENATLMARAVGWAVFGGLLGAGMGIRGGGKRVIHGLIGGLIGGAVGGVIFEQVSSDTSSAFTNRLLGLAATGVGVALGVGIVERLLRDAWLQVVGGPMTGKEFILYKEVTTVGAAPKCDIVLVKDGALAPHHLSFVRDQRGAVAVQPAPGAVVLVNGAQTNGQALRSGDAVTLGASTFLVQDRSAG